MSDIATCPSNPADIQILLKLHVKDSLAKALFGASNYKSWQVSSFCCRLISMKTAFSSILDLPAEHMEQ